MDALKQLFNILSWSMYLCIAGYLLIAALMLAGYRPVVVLGGSTGPAFPVGSIIYYKAASFEQIQERDPVTFHAGETDSLVTHRVVEKQELSRNFITRGNASKAANPNPVSYGRVAGRAPGVKVPYTGYFVTYGRTPQATGVMGGTLVIGVLLGFVCPGKRRGERA